MGVERVYLVGLSGAGKSTAGRRAAELLGWEFADSDALIETLAGRSIPEIFREEGEAAFRQREQGALEQLAARKNVVIATGGGAPTTAGSRAAMANGLVVWLDVTPEQAVRRLAANPATEARPLLEGDPLGRLQALFDERSRWYQLSDHSIAVDYYTPDQVARRIADLVRGAAALDPGRFGREERAAGRHVAWVETPADRYPIIVEPGVLGRLGESCRERGLAGRAFLVSDALVGPRFVPDAETSLREAGYTVSHFFIPPGESAKHLGTVSALYDWLLGVPVERSDFVICLGGGVVTDLGGFVAATTLRGLPFVHVPTTLLGMVDASIGGKTGIDHPRGKNLIGAFAQPAAVIIDPALLETLPPRELRSGWAELIKHGFILDEAMVADLERPGAEPGGIPSARLIARNVAIKAQVVSGDEREAGQRTLLNYGHTIGHAIEAVTGYATYTHGEAVAVGMRAAGLISVELGMLDLAGFERQQRLISGTGLPDRAPGLDADAIIAATLSDKKAQAGSVRWVLLERIGQATTRRDVPPALVRKAVDTVVA